MLLRNRCMTLLQAFESTGFYAAESFECAVPLFQIGIIG